MPIGSCVFYPSLQEEEPAAGMSQVHPSHGVANVMGDACQNVCLPLRGYCWSMMTALEKY